MGLLHFIQLAGDILEMQRKSEFEAYSCFGIFTFKAIGLKHVHDPEHFWPSHIKVTVGNSGFHHIIPVETIGM